MRVEGGYGPFIRCPTTIVGELRTTWWFRGAASDRCWRVAHFLMRCSLFLAPDDDIILACAKVACQWLLGYFEGCLGRVGPSWQSAVLRVQRWQLTLIVSGASWPVSIVL